MRFFAFSGTFCFAAVGQCTRALRNCTGVNADECQCGAGKFANQIGPSNSNCKQCLPGQSTNNKKGSNKCEICEDGFYQPFAGQPTCLQCPKGYIFKSYCDGRDINKHNSESSCTKCIQAKYQNEFGKEVCKACPIGKAGTGGGEVANDKLEDCEQSFPSPTPYNVKITTTTVSYSNTSTHRSRMKREATVSWQILKNELDTSMFLQIGNFEIEVAESKNFDAGLTKYLSISANARSWNISLVDPLWKTVLYAHIRVRSNNGANDGLW